MFRLRVFESFSRRFWLQKQGIVVGFEKVVVTVAALKKVEEALA